VSNPVRAGAAGYLVIRAALQKLSRHTLVYSLAEQLSRLAGFLLLPLITDYLGEAEFGTRELLATTIALLAQLAGVNVSAAMSRYYFDERTPAGRGSVISTSILAVAAAAGAVGGLALLSAGLWARVLPSNSPDLDLLLRIAFGIFVLQVVREVQNKALQTQERSVLYGSLAFSKLLVEIGLQILFLVGFGWGLAGLLWAVLAAEALFVAITSAILLPSIGLSFSKPVFAGLFAYSLPLVPNGLLQFCLHSADRYFVGSLGSDRALGLYALAYKLGYLPNYVVLGPFLLIWYPFVFSLESDAKRREMIARLAPIFMLFMTAATLAVGLFAEPLVALAASRESFHTAWTSVPVVAFGYWLWGLFQILQTGFYVTKATGHLPRLTAAAAIVNAFLNFTLIPALGYFGAAVATALTFAALCWSTERSVRATFEVAYPWARILAPAFAAAAALVAFHEWPLAGGASRPWWSGAIAFVLWSFAAVPLAFTRDEKSAVLAWWRARAGGKGERNSTGA
jgi:O-antigen/teichoic acid export membrane protein